jgi:PEGA domain-containing protein
VNRQTVVIIAVGFVLLSGAVVTLIRTRPRPEPPAATRSSVGRTSPTRATAAAESGKTDAPAVAPEPARRPARRAPAVKPGPSSVAGGAAPVDTSSAGGTLHIDSDVPGAQVFIDREYIGAAPVTASDVKPGTHRLNVSAQGYEGVADTIEVAPGPRDIVIKLKEVRLDVRIDVVHKHRFGSCKGRLIATSRGVRYETTNKDDGFSSALLDVGAFQVDYLEKNLRVTLRNGKRYDFTDPDGNADRLFVFHRDVEKARERLRKGDPPAGS